ncbi:MAG: hypothetical protein R3F14_32990 [Polyangiaceae bacterium]
MEQTFRAAEGVLLVEGRVLRRIIKAHRHIRGLGIGVPHVHCYAIPRDALLRLAAPEDLDPNVRNNLTRATDLRTVILVARLSQVETSRLPPAEVTNRLWRAAFHARIHVEIEQRIDSGALPEAALRERIDRIGQTEFDEIREILRQDDLLLPPGGDREAYAEFVALFLELKFFAPRLLATTFPSLDADRVGPEIARDIDARLLLERACPDGVDPGATIALATAAGTTSTATLAGPAPEAARFVAPEGSAAERMLERAQKARAAGNLVRSALLNAAVGLGRDPARIKLARSREREDLEQLSDRLKSALRSPPGAPQKPDLEWTSQLLILTQEAAARSEGIRHPVEARLLFDLLDAALAHEKTDRTVDSISWALALGKRPFIRPLPSTRTLRIARALHAAARKVKHVRLAPADRKLLTKLLDRAGERADDNVRSELRPTILSVLDEVGLRPISTPERVARDKLVEELLDQATHHGFFNMGHVRDALSRNHLKLDDLASASELWKGDALLRADKAFRDKLDGVYRPAEVYMRGLQKVSSVLFGTKIGRGIVLYAILPLGGAFILLEGAGHILAPALKPLGVQHLSLFIGGPAHSPLPEAISGFTTLSFWVTAVVVFGLLHSDPFRAVFMKVVRSIGKVLGFLFITVPRSLLALPSVERVLEGRPARVVARHALIPAFISTIVYLLLLAVLPHGSASNPGAGESIWIPLAITLSVFASVSVALGTRLGDVTEDMFVEHVAPTWKMVSAKVVPGMFRAIVDFFRWLMEGLERILYRVDEALRFHEGESKLSIGAKAFLGAIWFFVAYALRVYVALLIEPYVNPVKQVPMTAAAHKMMLPFAPKIIAFFDAAFRPLGSLIGGTLAAVTAFFFPTIFGFFGWELKENYKLYRASRKKELGEAVIGAHGETMTGFLVPGFHSGTLPKLFARLRHSARREEETATAAAAAGREVRRPKEEGARGRFREGTGEVEDSIRHFVEREMLCLLSTDPRWTHGDLLVRKVAVSSNRVRVSLACPGVSKSQKDDLELTFEEQSGYVVGGVAHTGFADALRGAPRVLFENALAGLYKLASVDLVREQIETALGAEMPYDIADDGLLVWPGPGYTVEALYPLRTDAPVIEPTLRGGLPARPLPPLDARAISFRHQPIAWSAWVYAWTPETGKEVPRLMSGPSLIPAVPHTPTPPPAMAASAPATAPAAPVATEPAQVRTAPVE